MINIDIFSRTAFDEAAAIAYARAAFEPGDMEVRSVQRATRWLGQQERVEEAAAPGGDDTPQLSSPVVYRCLWPGGCLRSTGSAMMKYCALHQGLLLPL